MKTLSQLLALVFVLVGLGSLFALAIVGAPIPILLTTVVVGALAGRFALLQESDIGVLVCGLLALAFYVTLSALRIAVPDGITMTLVGALTGHLALTLPAVAPNPPVVTSAPLAAPRASPAPALEPELRAEAPTRLGG